eukprot:TRINITY_DN6279_c0_g1_i2.p1 TRINITY_DN6279_c0_g1~~TRINITY_DN6279_c0_g1_i2.p1  ORF type:complete len:201 (-),score=1.01 TRINITY_DN6279_c0_g1_i2:23-574(-)
MNIWCPNNIEILNSTFDRVVLYVDNSDKVVVKNSIFKNVAFRDCALDIGDVKGQVTIENIEIFECDFGISICRCYNPIVKNVKIENYMTTGLDCIQARGANLSNIKMTGVGCGFSFSESNAQIEDCSVDDFKNYSLSIRVSWVHYKRLFLNNNLIDENNNLLELYENVKKKLLIQIVIKLIMI